MNDWTRFRDTLNSVTFPDLADIKATADDILCAIELRGAPDPYGDALRIIVDQLNDAAELLKGAQQRFNLLADHMHDQGDDADQGLTP